MAVFPGRSCCFFFFFTDPATTEIYTLSLHDALPIFLRQHCTPLQSWTAQSWDILSVIEIPDRKSTRLNSSHSSISYAVFCLKKKKPPRPGPRFRAQSHPSTRRSSMAQRPHGMAPVEQ